MNTIVTATPEIITAAPDVHGVKPVRSTLEDHMGDRLKSKYVMSLLADAEALNDEIDHLREVAQRAQQRETQAVKRCEELESFLKRIRGCSNSIEATLASKALQDHP